MKLIMGHTLKRDITIHYVQAYPAHKVKDACRAVRAVMLGKKWVRTSERAMTPEAIARDVFG